MSLAARLSAPDPKRGGRGGSARRSPRPGPYERPSAAPDGNWSHDKFVEANNLPQGSLAGRISGGEVGKGPNRLFTDAITASKDGSAPRGRVVSGGISIKGVSSSTTTVEVRELIAGTTADDVKLIFGTLGEIKSARSVPSKSPGTATVRLTYTNRQDMLNAIREFNGKTADGRTLSVVEVSSEAAPPPPPRGGDLLDDGPSGSSSGGKMYSDSLEGGVKVDRPPRINDGSWSRGVTRGGRRGRGGRGGPKSQDEGMQVD